MPSFYEIYNPKPMPKLDLEPILAIVKNNKKRFYRTLWKNYGNGALLLDKFEEIVEDKMPAFLWATYADKNYARELKVIYLAVDSLLFGEYPINGTLGWYNWLNNRAQIATACERLHKKYWQRFHKFYVLKRVSRVNGDKIVWPTMEKTQALKEFLAMGYIYKTEFKYDPTKDYVIFAHIGGLFWPEKFKLHQDAIEKMKEVGIPGLTGTTTLKDK